MERRTIREAQSGRCRVKIDGAVPMFCSFDYVIQPEPTIPGIEVQIGDAPDGDTVKWFPDVRRGMERGRQHLRARGRELVGVLITITKIYAHDIDTTAIACERYGSSFIYGFGWVPAAADAE